MFHTNLLNIWKNCILRAKLLFCQNISYRNIYFVTYTIVIIEAEWIFSTLQIPFIDWYVYKTKVPEDELKAIYSDKFTDRKDCLDLAKHGNKITHKKVGRSSYILYISMLWVLWVQWWVFLALDIWGTETLGRTTHKISWRSNRE